MKLKNDMNLFLKFFYLFFGIIMIAVGGNILITKFIPQDSRGGGPGPIDMTSSPIIAYCIGSIFILYGLYILINLFKYISCSRKHYIETIEEIGINNNKQFYIKMNHIDLSAINEKFLDVEWSNECHCLYGLNKRNWLKIDLFRHMITIAKRNSIILVIDENTLWINIDESLKKSIHITNSFSKKI